MPERARGGRGVRRRAPYVAPLRAAFVRAALVRAALVRAALVRAALARAVPGHTASPIRPGGPIRPGIPVLGSALVGAFVLPEVRWAQTIREGRRVGAVPAELAPRRRLGRLLRRARPREHRPAPLVALAAGPGRVGAAGKLAYFHSLTRLWVIILTAASLAYSIVLTR